MQASQTTDFDAIVVGAGFAGVALTHYLREAGLSLKVFDRAPDIGGTWAGTNTQVLRLIARATITA